MTPANTTLNSSVPSLAAIQHRRRELLACQAGQRQAQATALHEEPLPAEDSSLEEEARLIQNPADLAAEALEELDESDDPEEPYPAEYPAPPSTASACGRSRSG